MKWRTLFLPYDVYSRHRASAEFLGTGRMRILDVGGSLKELGHFLGDKQTLFVTDIIGGDVISSGDHLPFKEKSVDAVISLDTIEHIAKEKRAGFIKELFRVAKRTVVVAAPLGTKSHRRAEKLELEASKAKGVADHYLQEHVQYGLPHILEIKSWMKQYPAHELLFSGNHMISRILFRFHRFELPWPKANRLWYEVKKLLSAIINFSLYRLEKHVPFRESVNRFYLIIQRV